MTPATRIVIYEDGADLLPEPVIREQVAANDTGPRLLPPLEWAGTGPARGEYEAERAAVEYVPPSRRAA
jgi:hypothetical protein